MKRHKIKSKYLKLTKSKTNNELSNKIATIERKIFKSLTSFLWIILMLFWAAIPNIILIILNINPNDLSTPTKYIITFINDLLFLFILIKTYYKTIKENFKTYFNNKFISNLKQSIKYWLLGLIIMYISNIIIAITIGELSQNEESLRTLIDISPIYMAFQIIIYAPLTEEIIFRKSIRDIFDNKWSFALISGLIFGGLHAITSITNMLSLLYLIPYCSLGIIFGLLYYKSNNIFSTIMAHSIHNTLALILYFITL